MVTQRAQKILKSILRDIPKIGDVTTTELLYRYQELSWVLYSDKDTKIWIQQELMGYAPQVYGKFNLPKGAISNRNQVHREVNRRSHNVSCKSGRMGRIN